MYDFRRQIALVHSFFGAVAGIAEETVQPFVSRQVVLAQITFQRVEGHVELVAGKLVLPHPVKQQHFV